MNFWISKCLLVLWLVAQASCRTLSEAGDLKLTILHVNDIHAHVEQTSTDLTRCRPEDLEKGDCLGGGGRLLTKINEIRDEDPEHTLVLNAGDFYQGTIWYSLFKYKPLLELANLYNYTAMGLGNHDFDDGVEGLLPFAESANFAILAANLNITKEPELERYCKKSVVMEIDGHKVGIIGYVTTHTVTISHPGENVIFLDEISSVREEAIRLKKDENVDILIALGHSGYELDLQMAAEIEELDVVVGGHSHTFLYTGDNLPSTEKPQGPYPTYVTQKNNRVVPVVQAYCYSKYLGSFDLYFDSNGELKIPVDGAGVKNASPILLDKSIEEDEDVLQLIEEYKPNMTEYQSVVGSSVNDLTRNGTEECTMGNFITDSMVNGEWSDTTIGFINNGGIRSDLKKGNITGEDILSVLPFGNYIDRVIMNGEGIKFVLETFASNLCTNQSCYPGTFVQVSGLRIVYRIKEDNKFHRIESIKTFCDGIDRKDIEITPVKGFENRVTYNEDQWCAVEDKKNYTIALSSFLARGGSRSLRFEDNILDHKFGTVPDYDTFKKYLYQNSPLNQKLEGRLTFFYEPGVTTSTTTQKTTTSNSPRLNPTPVLTFIFIVFFSKYFYD